MRRRVDSAPATNLTVFDGRQYRTPTVWKAAFDEFLAARTAWSREHDGAPLPTVEINGHQPFDWSRFRKSVPD